MNTDSDAIITNACFDDDEKIKELKLIVKNMTSENVKLQESLKDCQKHLHVLQERRKYLKTTMASTSLSKTNKLQKINNLAKISDVPYSLNDYLQIWGFTENEAHTFCYCIGTEKTEDLTHLKPLDWEPGGDVYRIHDLSDAKKEYLKWLCDKVKNQDSSLNADIIKDISSKWRDELQFVWEVGLHQARVCGVV